MGDSGQESRTRTFGEFPPQRLGLIYVLVVLALEALGSFVPAAAIGAGVVELVALATLVFIVAFLRDDDAIEAGVLLALITGVASLASTAIIASVRERSLGPLIMTLPGAFLGIAIRAVIWGSAGAAVVWGLRRLRGDQRPVTRAVRRRRFG